MALMSAPAPIPMTIPTRRFESPRLARKYPINSELAAKPPHRKAFTAVSISLS